MEGTIIGRGVIPVHLDPSSIEGGLTALGSRMTGKLRALGTVGGGALAAGIGAAVAGTAALVKIGHTFESMEHIIAKTTGASGEDLKRLQEAALEVGKKTPASFDDIGLAIGNVAARLHITGKPLQEVSLGLIRLTRVTGTDLKSNIANVTRLFGDWSVSADHQAFTLDKLLTASQNTGIGVDTLSNLMVKFGSPLRALGFDFDHAAAMFSRFEREGVNIQTTMPGLRMALKNFAKEGLDPAKALQQTIDKIKTTKSESEAMTLAFKVFGARAGPDMARAIIEGRFNLEKLVGTLRSSRGRLSETSKEVRTMSGAWELLKHRVMIPLEPIAARLFTSMTHGVIALSDAVLPISDKIGKAIRGMFGEGGGRGFGEAIGVLGRFGKEILPEVARQGQRIGETLRPAFQTIGASLRDDLIPAFQKMLPILIPVGKFIIQVLGSAVIGAIKGTVQAITGLIDVISGLVNFVDAVIHGEWGNAWKALKQIASGALNLVIGLIKVWWNVSILNIFRKGVIGLITGWKGLWTGLGRLAKSGGEAVGKLFTGALRLLGRLIVGAVKGYISLWKNYFLLLFRVGKIGWTLIRAGFSIAINALRTVLSSYVQFAMRRWNAFWDTFRSIGGKIMSLIRETIPTAFRRGVDAIGRIFGTLREAAMKPVRFVVNTVYTEGIRRVVNAIPGVGDLPAVKLAKGGPVRGGIRGRDSVRALLMPDEHVFTAEEVKKAGGHKVILAMREFIRRYGLRGFDPDPPRFAKGGFLRPEQIRRAQAFASSQVGKPYLWGGVGPIGYDCSGFMSAITNVLLGRSPYSRVGATATFPWRGFMPGPGEFTIGSSKNYGGSGVGHMAGTLAGLNVESRGGAGVVVGSGARGYYDKGFSTVAHLGAKISGGGGLLAVLGDIKSFLSKAKGWLGDLAHMGGWGGMMKQMVGSIVGSLRNWFKDKVPGFDTGGIWRGGLAFNATGRPERVLDPGTTRTFDRFTHELVRGRRYGSSIASGRGGRTVWEIRIVNWATGEGYIRAVARDEAGQDDEFDSTHGRMGGTG